MQRVGGFQDSTRKSARSIRIAQLMSAPRPSQPAARVMVPSAWQPRNAAKLYIMNTTFEDTNSGY